MAYEGRYYKLLIKYLLKELVIQQINDLLKGF